MAKDVADGAQSGTPRPQRPAKSCHYRPQSTRSHGTTLTQRQVATCQCTSMLSPVGGGLDHGHGDAAALKPARVGDKHMLEVDHVGKVARERDRQCEALDIVRPLARDVDHVPLFEYALEGVCLVVFRERCAGALT